MANQTTNSRTYSLFILGVSIFSILLIAIVTLVPLNPEDLKIIYLLDYIICAIFFVDFLVSFVRAESKKKYFFTWGWFDLLSSIPAVYFLRFFRFARIIRIGRVLRGIRAGKILASFVVEHRAQSGIIAALMLTILIVLVGSISILHVEQGMGGNINTAEDALWWAVTTMTTVGYGDKYPLSTEGRFIAATLMFAGIGLFGIVSGFLAAWFINPSRRQEAQEASDYQLRVEGLQTRIDGLDGKLEEILGLLREKGEG